MHKALDPPKQTDRSCLEVQSHLGLLPQRHAPSAIQLIFLPIKPASSSSSSTVSSGLAIHAVVPTLRARKSFAPADRNWSPTCSVFSGRICSVWPAAAACFSKYFWQTVTPHDLSPISTNTSRPPLLEAQISSQLFVSNQCNGEDNKNNGGRGQLTKHKRGPPSAALQDCFLTISVQPIRSPRDSHAVSARPPPARSPQRDPCASPRPASSAP